MVLIMEDFLVSRSMAKSSCAALTVALWDWILCLPDEVDFIWRRPHGSFIKWLYVVFRYVGLIALVVNLLFVKRMETYAPISRDRCQLWIIYQASIVEFFLVMVNALLIMRVSAIWSHNRIIVIVLWGLVLLEVSFMVHSASVIAPDTTMNELCLFRETPRAAALFGAVELVIQSVILLLTLRRNFCSKLIRSLRRMNLFILVIRDGGLAFLGITAMFIGTFSYTLLGSAYTDNLFYWIVCVLSICGCRMIVNTDAFAASASPEPFYRTSDAIWLTSGIMVYDDEDPGI